MHFLNESSPAAHLPFQPQSEVIMAIVLRIVNVVVTRTIVSRLMIEP